MRIAITELRDKVLGTLLAAFPLQEAAEVADYLVWAEMSGIHTQGIVKLAGTEPLQGIVPRGEVHVERDTSLSQLINANAHPAPFVSNMATRVAIAKAKEHGFALVGVHNFFSSNGALAYYGEVIARSGLIGMVMARSPGAVAPFGTIDPLFGTNPVCFAFPTLDQPLVFDTATSAMTWYGLVVARANGDRIPQGVAIDHSGKPTVDPDAAMKGALMPFDGSYRGSGLGMVVEIMAGPLAASAHCDCNTFAEEWGSSFLALDPALLVDPGRFRADVSDLMEVVRNARRMGGAPVPRLPGERARKSWELAQGRGTVDVDQLTMVELGYI